MCVNASDESLLSLHLLNNVLTTLRTNFVLFMFINVCFVCVCVYHQCV